MNVLRNIDLVLDYLDNMADVVDGDYGQPEPNEEMNLSRELQEAREAILALLSAGAFLASNPAGMITDGAIARWNRSTAMFGVKP